MFEDEGEVIDLIGLVNRFEVRALHIAMEEAGGNSTVAAEILGMNRSTLVERRRKLGLVIANPRKPRPTIASAVNSAPQATE